MITRSVVCGTLFDPTGFTLSNQLTRIWIRDKNRHACSCALGWRVRLIITGCCRNSHATNQCLKIERSVFRQRRTSCVRISVIQAWALSFGTKLLWTDKSVWNPNRLFGFQTQIYQFTCMCLKSKHFVLFELQWMSENRTSSFRMSGYRTSGLFIYVRLSDVYCISNV